MQCEAPVENVTLGELIAAVLDVTDDEDEATYVVMRMIARGSVRLRSERRA